MLRLPSGPALRPSTAPFIMFSQSSTGAGRRPGSHLSNNTPALRGSGVEKRQSCQLLQWAGASWRTGVEHTAKGLV